MTENTKEYPTTKSVELWNCTREPESLYSP
jgi:hypothetical protein